METIKKRQNKDIRLIGKFVQIYCRDCHGADRRDSFPLPSGLDSILICPECVRFMEYVVEKRIKCPLEFEKPSCKKCRIHCYAAAEREKIRKIMAYSGRKMILRGRLDYLWRYLF